MSVTRLRILYAVEALLPPLGGAERFGIELVEGLGERHDVTALFLRDPDRPPGALSGVSVRAVDAPPAPDGYWARKRLRREAVADAVRAELGEHGADVVATTLHAGPGAVAAAAEAGVPTVIFLHSYEPLCKYAYDVGSGCVPESRCERCPMPRALAPAERAEFDASRREHAASLETADGLVAACAFLADACEAWTGRTPAVVAGSARDMPAVRADPDGPVMVVAAKWSVNKGRDLLAPLAAALHEALPGRRLAITANGIDGPLAERLGRLPNVGLVPNAPIHHLLDGAAALLVPSQWSELFGCTVFEGLAARVPTLASAVGGLPEYVPPEQLVSPPGDPEAWAGALTRLLEPGPWEDARRRGRAAAEAVLATDPIARAEEALLAVARLEATA